jgi:hypothetical protein
MEEAPMQIWSRRPWASGLTMMGVRITEHRRPSERWGTHENSEEFQVASQLRHTLTEELAITWQVITLEWWATESGASLTWS